jgi:hypothetical protein
MLKRAAAAILLMTTVLACGPTELGEQRATTTAKLLKPQPTNELPASNAGAAQRELGGARLDIDRWEGYVAGSDDDALFTMHLSGLKGTEAVAGLTIAFVEGKQADDASDLEDRLRATSMLTVHFNNGSGVTATHAFGAGATSSADPRDGQAEALLQRAYSDAQALLHVQPGIIVGDDRTRECLANFLMTVSNAARCVDDAANSVECTAVRGDAVNTAASCQGTKTANVLAGNGTLRTQALPNVGSIFGMFTKLSSGGISSGAGGLGGIASLLGGLAGGGGGAGGMFGKLMKFLPTLFGNSGLKASPLTGLISLINK